MIVAGLDRINTIVTDDGAKPEELEDFRSAGIKVIVAKVTEEDELKSSPDTGPGFTLNRRILFACCLLVAALSGCGERRPASLKLSAHAHRRRREIAWATGSSMPFTRG